jgi:hypothetical protein
MRRSAETTIPKLGGARDAPPSEALLEGRRRPAKARQGPGSGRTRGLSVLPPEPVRPPRDGSRRDRSPITSAFGMAGSERTPTGHRRPTRPPRKAFGQTRSGHHRGARMPASFRGALPAAVTRTPRGGARSSRGHDSPTGAMPFTLWSLSHRVRPGCPERAPLPPARARDLDRVALPSCVRATDAVGTRRPRMAGSPRARRRPRS